MQSRMHACIMGQHKYRMPLDHSNHRSVLFFIQILYRLFESNVYHVASNKPVNLPTKLAASSVERYWWMVCGRMYLANKITS